MISRFWFDDPAAAARAHAVAAADPSAAPLLLTEATVLHELCPDLAPTPPRTLVTVARFADLDHLARFDRSSSATTSATTSATSSATVEEVAGALDDDRVLDTDTSVVRGKAPAPGEVTGFKHMAFARRAVGLTIEEFSAAWAAHAGTAAGRPIPDAARGTAYAQSRPIVRPGIDPVFDALNETWCADLDALRARVDWFTSAEMSSSDGDLFGERHFLALRETEVPLPISASPTPTTKNRDRD